MDGEDEVALILATGVIDNHDRFAHGNGSDGVVDGIHADVAVFISVMLRSCRHVLSVLRGDQQALNVLGEHIDFDIDRVTRLTKPQGGEF